MEPKQSFHAAQAALNARILWLLLALSGVAAIWSVLRSPLSLLVVLPATVVSAVLLRERDADREEQVRLEDMVEALRTASSAATQLEGGIHALLGSARQLFDARYAEVLVLPGEEGDHAHRSAAVDDGETIMTPEPLSDTDRLVLDAVGRRGREPVVVSRGTPDPDLAQLLQVRGLRNAIVGVLYSSTGELGLAVVGDLGSEEGEPGSADATVFGTFCSHASVVLENARLGQSLDDLLELKERLQHQAFHDALTGLPNRVLFGERVAAALDRHGAGGAGSSPTILLLDLDDFKIINDTWGHAAGDELLVGVADRLRQAIRPTDTPARLGGDEFAVLLADASLESAEMAAQRITMAFTVPIAVHEHSIVARPSIGVAVAGRDASAERLLRNADAAMYEAKRDDVRHVAVYEEETHAATRRRRELRLQLDEALERFEIELHFQPIVSIADGEILALEALARWAHPAYGLMLPGEFLPIADNRQLAGIGRRVIREALRNAGLWQGVGTEGRRIGVWINLSAVDVTSEWLVDDVLRGLGSARLDPELLTLEITESSVIVGEDVAVENVKKLREAGIRVAIDDFGTGYSSLSRLGDFPLDLLKIPQPFVERLSDESPDIRLVDAILRLAGSLGLGVVAEGVESGAQARVLAELGCTLVQGYLFAPALDGEQVMRLLRSGLRLPEAHGFEPGSYWLYDDANQSAA